MMGDTHRWGGTVFMLGTFEYMRQHGMLMPEVHPLVQLAVMYPASSFGAIMPDLDHHEGSIPSKTPFALVFHKVLHLTKPKHRSWQTHSWLVTGSFMFLLYALVLYGTNTWGGTDWVIMRLIIYGFIVGWLSHMILDMLSPQGVWLYPGLKVRFVPKAKYFATGGPWEVTVVKNAMKLLCAYFALTLAVYSIWDIEITTLIIDWISTKINGA